MRPLTEAEIEEIQKEMVPFTEGVPVRFLYRGQAVNIETGETTPRGTNVICHIVYWCFTRETALKIARLTGTKPVFDKGGEE